MVCFSQFGADWEPDASFPSPLPNSCSVVQPWFMSRRMAASVKHKAGAKPLFLPFTVVVSEECATKRRAGNKRNTQRNASWNQSSREMKIGAELAWTKQIMKTEMLMGAPLQGRGMKGSSIHSQPTDVIRIITIIVRASDASFSSPYVIARHRSLVSHLARTSSAGPVALQERQHLETKER